MLFGKWNQEKKFDFYDNYDTMFLRFEGSSQFLEQYIDSVQASLK